MREPNYSPYPLNLLHEICVFGAVDPQVTADHQSQMHIKKRHIFCHCSSPRSHYCLKSPLMFKCHLLNPLHFLRVNTYCQAAEEVFDRVLADIIGQVAQECRVRWAAGKSGPVNIGFSG